MPYSYEVERPNLFTPDGVKLLISVRDNVQYLLRLAGAVRLQEAIGGATGDSWHMLAAIDYLVELGELREITAPGVPGQYRVLVSSKP